MDEEIKRWTAKRKSALVMEIIQGKTTVAEAARAFDLPPSEIEEWVDDVKEYGDLYELIQIAQQSKELDINDDYIRTSIYYYGYSTSDSVIDLVEEDEATEWIANALEDRSDLLEDINKVMKIKFN